VTKREAKRIVCRVASILLWPEFRSDNDWIAETADNEKDREKLEEAMKELSDELARRGEKAS